MSEPRPAPGFRHVRNGSVAGLLSLLALTACAPQDRPADSGSEAGAPEEAAPSDSAAVDRPGATDEEGTPRFAWVMDPVTARLGLPPLREAAHPDGVRELRIWIGFGNVLPHDLLRLVESDAGVEGERYAWWYVRDDGPGDPLVGHPVREEGACDLPEGAGWAVCLVEDDPPAGWERLLEALRRHRVFQLPDAPTYAERAGLDGRTLLVEILDGERYRTYSYGYSGRPRGSEGRDARAINEIVLGLDADEASPESPEH